MGIDKNSTSFIDSQSGLNSFAYKNWPQLQMCREHRQTNEANFAASTALASPASGSAPRVFDMRTVGNSLQWEERLPLSVRSAAASSSGLQTLRRPAPGILRVVENALPFLDDNCLKVTVPSSGRSATRPVSRRQMLLEEAADAVAGQFSSAQQAEREVLQVLARRLEALTDATLHAVREVGPAALGPHVDTSVSLQVMESAAATATVGSATAGGTTLGWQHVLRELQLPLRWPDSLPSAESMLSEQLLQRVARRLDVIFCSKKV